jgi:Tol biopolymer transport system component
MTNARFHPFAIALLAMTFPASSQQAAPGRRATTTLLSSVAPTVAEIRSALVPEQGMLAPQCVVSPDGRHAAWIWQERNVEFVMQDGRTVGAEYGSIHAASLTFSPDSRRFAFFAKDRGRSLCILDGVAGKPYDRLLGRPVFSQDGQHLAYVAEMDGQQTVVLDGKEQARHAACERPIFSPDGRHLAYAAKDGKGVAWVLDGVPGRTYEEGGPGGFSPEGNRFAYVASLGGSKFVVLDGQEQKPYRNILSAVLFSPDGRRCAYLATDFKTQFFVLDGKETPTPFSVDQLAFSPDSRRVAYAGGDAKGTWFVVIDGRETKYRTGGFLIGSPGRQKLYFSPDSRHVAFAARDLDRGKQEFLVLDGKEGPPWDAVLGGTPTFSPKGDRHAYLARQGGRYVVVVDGQAGRPYERILRPVLFSEDGRHVAYLADRGKHAWTAVIDGREGGTSFSVVPGSGHFEPSGVFRYLALRPGTVGIQDPKTRKETVSLELHLVEEEAP